MFITTRYSGYNRNDEQVCAGKFLILMTDDSKPFDTTANPIRGMVRYVHMSPLGNFMMGLITVKGHKLSLSGSYGADGLCKDVPTDVYNLGVELPSALVEKGNHGGGWNSAGNEADAMRQWALGLPQRRVHRSKWELAHNRNSW